MWACEKDHVTQVLENQRWKTLSTSAEQDVDWRLARIGSFNLNVTCMDYDLKNWLKNNTTVSGPRDLQLVTEPDLGINIHHHILCLYTQQHSHYDTLQRQTFP